MIPHTPPSGPLPQTGGGVTRRTRWGRFSIVALVVAALVALAGAAYGLADSGTAQRSASAPARPHRHGGRSVTPAAGRSLITSVPATVAPTTAPPATTVPSTVPTVPPPTTPAAPTAVGSHGPITSPPLPAPGPGFNAGQVTAVGDSVLLDYQALLQQDIPGIDVQAAVSEQWSAGESELEQLKAEGQLGAVVIVALSTNGPISSADFADMAGILSGASRVVFVNIHVDQPWQDSNNAVLAAGVQQTPDTVLADWYDLAQQNPGWLYSDQTHLPVDGPGAQALADLVASQA